MPVRPRLERRMTQQAPGEWLWEPRGVAGRLLERDEIDLRERAELGASVVVRDVKVKTSSRRIEVGPNSPLLMRLWQSPYALEKGSPRRTKSREAREMREAPPSISIVWREAREDWPKVVCEGPIAALGPRLVARPRASAADWLGGQS
jgi:hypothetical protein